MIVFIFSLTLRQLLSRKSTLLLIGLATLPVLLALVYQISDSDTSPERWASRVLYVGLIITAVLPLTALLLGTSVIGDEIEDGTVVYLLTKPVPRWQILLPKLAAAWLLTTAIVLTSTVISGLLALQGTDDGSKIILGFSVAVIVGALAYAAVFALLSVMTSRALVTGLIYVFLWEGAITGIFTGTRYLSIRHFSIGLAGWIAGSSDATFNAYVGGATALILVTITTVVATLLATEKLAEVELRDQS